MNLSDRRIRLGRLHLYIEPRDLWVGAFVDSGVLYVCPLPCLVVRWTRTTAQPARSTSTVAQPVRERPWMPGADMIRGLPEGNVLISPAGVSHLLLDVRGQWWHLQASGPHRQVTAGQAALLQPNNVGLVVKMSMLWAWNCGSGNPRATDMVDDLSAGVQTLVTHYGLMAGQRAKRHGEPV